MLKRKDRLNERIYPRVVVRMNVACQSSRSTGVSLIVLHDTESANVPHSSRDIAAIGDFFNRPSTQASAHVAVDADGQSGRYVSDAAKAWACVSYNSASLNIEQIAFASQTEWSEAELNETARWIALWSREHGIPIRKGSVYAGAVTRSGVVQHKDLGSYGGGHSDCGPNYPFRTVLRKARRYRRLQERYRWNGEPR